MTDQRPRITIAEFDEINRRTIPLTEQYGFVTEHIGYGEARVRLPYDENHLRAGGTISGPAMMALADFTFYAVVLGMIGKVELAATTNLNINFLQRPEPADLLAHGTIIKLGKRLAVCEATILPDGADDPVAHVTGTYSIPPER
jgi:uncharacterized protein (TIGR00369 family)